MSVYLFTPPMWTNPVPMGGGLVPGIPTSTVVYRQGGVWFNVLDAGEDSPVVADCDEWVDAGNAANTLRLFFRQPMVVPGDLFDGLSALQKGDPSWSDAVLTLL